MSATSHFKKEDFPSPELNQVGRGRVDHLYMPLDHMEDLYDSKNPLVKFVHLNRLDSIARQIPPEKELTLLDAGCGEGHLLERLYLLNSSCRYYGADITPAALTRAQERCPWATFKKMNLSSMEFPAVFFDVVICTEVLEHIYEYEAVIEELKRILKPGGCLIITFPNEALWTAGRFLLRRKPVKVPDHVNSFYPHHMNSLVNLKLKNQLGLPFGLPFFLSLSCLMKFEKGDASG